MQYLFARARPLFRIGVRLSGSSPAMQVAETILDGDRVACQVVKGIRDSLLARPRGECSTERLVDLGLPPQSRHRFGEFTIRVQQIRVRLGQPRRIAVIAIVRCSMCQGGAGLLGQNGQQ